jgi:hypothetical protein
MSELELIFSTLLRKDLEGGTSLQSHSLHLVYVNRGMYRKLHIIRYAKLQCIHY